MNPILITGVSSGIGQVTTKFLIERGYHVFGSVRSAADADRCRKAYGGAFTPLLFDVRDIEAIKQAADLVKSQIGSTNLRALINNAGIAISGPLQFINPQDIQDQFDINVIGLINTTQAFLPLLGGEINNFGPKGRIINISSVAGTITMPFQIPYAASKHAVESINDGLRRELSPYGIKVISIRPGPVKSEIWFKELDKKADIYDHTIYREVWSGKNDLIAEKEKNAAPTISVAKAILRAIEDKNPNRHTIVYNDMLKYYFSRWIPTRWLDGLIQRQLTNMMKPKK